MSNQRKIIACICDKQWFKRLDRKLNTRNLGLQIYHIINIALKTSSTSLDEKFLIRVKSNILQNNRYNNYILIQWVSLNFQ